MRMIVIMPVGHGKSTLARTDSRYRDVDDAFKLLDAAQTAEFKKLNELASRTGDYSVVGPMFDALVARWAREQPDDAVLLVHGLSQARAIIAAGLQAKVFKYDLPTPVWLSRFHVIRSESPERARHMLRGLNDHMRPEVRALPTFTLLRTPRKD